MSPNNDSRTTDITPLQPERPLEPTQTTPTQQQAAVAVVRSQIDSLFDTTAPQIQPVATSQLVDVNPYDRTHTDNPLPEQDQWKQYHSAWQTYYQKYYEGYYTHHLNQAVRNTARAQTDSSAYFSKETQQVGEHIVEQTMTKEEALFDLRQKLLSRVQHSAKKVRKSRHFVPISAAVLVVLIFAFLQYNQLIIANVVAYVSPGSIDPQNIVVDPSTDVNVTADPRLIIPKINVDVPVLYDVGNDNNSQMAAMQKGVAQFAIPGASSHPGQLGNTVIAGHSSNDLLDPGDYKFIFAQLEKLAVGDTIYANYQSKRYTYTISKLEVVKPSEINRLVYAASKPVLTLVTCTPLGTSRDRLLVTAEQVSPSTTTSTAAPVEASSAQVSIPGNSPTLLERLFGG